MFTHTAAFAAISGVEILYDRIKAAVIGEDEAGVVTYNAALVALRNHYGALASFDPSSRRFTPISAGPRSPRSA